MYKPKSYKKQIIIILEATATLKNNNKKRMIKLESSSVLIYASCILGFHSRKFLFDWNVWFQTNKRQRFNVIFCQMT
jgi:hypothetical protein